MSITDQDYKTDLLHSTTTYTGENYRKLCKEHYLMMNSPDASAVASFRYRLREASRLALELGDKLLQLSQDAPEPNVSQLKTMREIEGFLDVLVRYNVRDLPNPALRP